MGRGKQSAAGQAKRRQQIIDYIRENGPVKSGDICAALSLSRSSLSDDINAINTQAPVLESPKRGWYQYNAESENRMSEGSIRGKLTRTYIRRWFILALLSESSLTFNELLDDLDDAGMSCSSYTLYSDLKALKEAHYLTDGSEEGRVSYQSEALLCIDKRELRNYRQAVQKGINQRMLVSSYDAIDAKLSHCVISGSLKVKAGTVRHVGKQNRISKEQLDVLERFQQFPYADYALLIPYITNRNIKISCTFSVGIVLYSIETNRIYLLGKDDDLRNTVIALDRICMDEVSISDEKHNYCFHTAEFTQMFEEMFHLSTEEPVDVSVRFQNLPFIAEKIKRLCAIRKNARTELISEDTEILYTDRLRGLDDFARYLRRFGMSAIVEKPEALREKMIYTSRKVISVYGKEDGHESI